MRSGCGWMLFSNPLEILPMDDMFDHHEGLGCWCVPEENEEGTIVHNAADGREMFETKRRKPS